MVPTRWPQRSNKQRSARGAVVRHREPACREVRGAHELAPMPMGTQLSVVSQSSGVS